MASNREIEIKVKIDPTQAVKGGKEAAGAISVIVGEAEKGKKEIKDMGKETTTVSGILQNVFGSQVPVIGKFTGAMGQARTVTTGLTASTNAFRVALAATGIGAVVVVLGMLIQAFRSTQEGTDRVSRVLTPLKVLFEALWGVVQNVSIMLADRLVAGLHAVKEPGRMVIDFVGTIIDRFISAIEFGGALGRMIRGLATGDLRLMREGLADAKLALDDHNRGLGEGETRLSRWAQGLREPARDAIEAGRRIQEINEQIEQMQIDQAVPLARMKREYHELRTIAGDSLETEETRLQAISDAMNLLQSKHDEQRKILDLEIERLELQQQFSDTSREEQLELQRLYAQREELAAQTLRDQRSFERRQSSILKGINEEMEAERQAETERIAALEQRADAFLEYLMSEEELKQQAFNKELESLQALLDEEILTREQFLEVRGAMEDRYFAEDEEKETARVGSIMELEEQLAVARLAYRQTVDDADREMHAEEMQRIQERLSEITGAETEIAGARKKGIDEAIAGSVQYTDSARANVRRMIDAFIAEAVAAQIRSVISTIPFPFNLAAAPAAAAGVAGMRKLIPEFREGGLTAPGRKIISVNEDDRPEYVVNADTTRRALPLLELMNANPGFAANLARSLQVQNQFRAGGPTGRVRTGADLPPIRPGGDSTLAAEIVKALQSATFEAIVAITDIDERLTDYHSLESSIGN